MSRAAWGSTWVERAVRCWENLDPLHEASLENRVYQAFRGWRDSGGKRVGSRRVFGGAPDRVVTSAARPWWGIWRWEGVRGLLAHARLGGRRTIVGQSVFLPGWVRHVIGSHRIEACAAEDLWLAGATGSEVVWARQHEELDAVFVVVCGFLVFVLSSLCGVVVCLREVRLPVTVWSAGLAVCLTNLVFLLAIVLLRRNRSPLSILARGELTSWRLASLATIDPGWLREQPEGHPARRAWGEFVEGSGGEWLRAGKRFVKVNAMVWLFLGMTVVLPAWLAHELHLRTLVVLNLAALAGLVWLFRRGDRGPVCQVPFTPDPQWDVDFDLFMSVVVMGDSDGWRVLEGGGEAGEEGGR